MGNLTLANVPVAIADQNEVNYYGGLRHLDGLFGAHEMYKFGGVIDCARQMIYINPTGPSAAASQKIAAFLTSRGFTRIPMRLNAGHHFEVDGAVNGHAVGFIIDTGSGTTLLTKDKAVSFGVMPVPLRLASEAPNHKVERLNSGEVKMLAIGAFEVPHAEVTLGNIFQRILSSDMNIGLLGEEYLTYNFAVIDVSGLALYLRHPDRR